MPPLAEEEVNSLRGCLRSHIFISNIKTYEPNPVENELGGVFPPPVTSPGTWTRNEVIGLPQTPSSYRKWHQCSALPEASPSLQTLCTAKNPHQAPSTPGKSCEMVGTRKYPGQLLRFPGNSGKPMPEEIQVIFKPVLQAQEFFCRVRGCSRQNIPFSIPSHARDHEQTHLLREYRKRLFCSSIGCTRYFLTRGGYHSHMKRHREGRKMIKGRSN